MLHSYNMTTHCYIFIRLLLLSNMFYELVLLCHAFPLDCLLALFLFSIIILVSLYRLWYCIVFRCNHFTHSTFLVRICSCWIIVLQDSFALQVNVLEPHPHLPILATSGLDNEIKMWVPTREEEPKLPNLQKVGGGSWWNPYINLRGSQRRIVTYLFHSPSLRAQIPSRRKWTRKFLYNS